VTRDDLLKELEPLTAKFDPKENVPAEILVPIIRRWIDTGEHGGIEHAFDIWNDVMGYLVIKYNLRGAPTKH